MSFKDDKSYRIYQNRKKRIKVEYLIETLCNDYDFSDCGKNCKYDQQYFDARFDNKKICNQPLETIAYLHNGAYVYLFKSYVNNWNNDFKPHFDELNWMDKLSMPILFCLSIRRDWVQLGFIKAEDVIIMLSNEISWLNNKLHYGKVKKILTKAFINNGIPGLYNQFFEL